jgi:hypothetical protein
LLKKIEAERIRLEEYPERKKKAEELKKAAKAAEWDEGVTEAEAVEMKKAADEAHWWAEGRPSWRISEYPMSLERLMRDMTEARAELAFVEQVIMIARTSGGECAEAFVAAEYKRRADEKEARGKALCASGHHSWGEVRGGGGAYGPVNFHYCERCGKMEYCDYAGR